MQFHFLEPLGEILFLIIIYKYQVSVTKMSVTKKQGS